MENEFKNIYDTEPIKDELSITEIYKTIEKEQEQKKENEKEKAMSRKEKARKMLKDKNDNFRWDKKAFDEISIQNNECTQEIIDRKNQENMLVYKDNVLAQKAKMEFNETELKCLNFCISKIKPNIVYTNKEIVFSLYEILTFMKLNYGNNDYAILKASLKQLRDKSVWVKKDNSEFLFFFLQECEIEKNENNKLDVKIVFGKKALELLQNLKIKFYAQYLYYTTVLKGKYTILFYELCKSWQKEKQFVFNINDIREKWNIPKTYKTNKIKIQILDYAIKQINELTDIKISILKTNYQKRKIISYLIGIETNKDAMMQNNRNFEKELKGEKK